jgi:predicted DNA-binding transcriptional regulator YafY
VLVGAPLQRVWHVHARLSRWERVTTETLAAELEVTTRTIKRDLDFMRDRLGLPIEWDAGERTFVYTRPCDALPMLCIDAREALAFTLASRLLGGLRESPLGGVLEAVFAKIAGVLGGAVSVAAESVDRVLSTPAVPQAGDLRHFLPLLEAILARRVLRLDYAKPKAAQAERRVVHPLHLVELDRRWRLIAYDTGRRAVRQFVVDRIRTVTTLGDTFTPPADFDVKRFLAGSMGAFVGGPEREVRLALDAEAAAYARERPWHASQTLRPLPDGRAEIALCLNNLTDVKLTALRWGSHAEVLAPADLRAEVAAELRAAAGRYRA